MSNQQIDSAAVTELHLCIENDGRVYPKRLAIEANLRRKVQKMVYDLNKATTAWLHFVDAGVKLYRADFPGTPPFNRATRLAVAELFARGFEAEIAIELQAAKEGAFEEMNVNKAEHDSTGSYQAFRRLRAAQVDVSQTVNVQAAFNAVTAGAR